MSTLNFTTKEPHIGWIEWDQPESSANVLSVKMLDELSELVTRLEKETTLKALVIASKKPSIFIAGADIKDIQNRDTAEEFQKVLEKAHAILNRFENLPMSKIACINGSCLGGGFELALTCDYRIVSDSPHVKIGLPEVKLGLIPGFGGCIRLPRLVGLQNSLGMILTGKVYPARVAYKKKLADEIVPQSILLQRTLELAREIVNQKKPKHPQKSFKKRHPYLSFLEKITKPFICFIAKRNVLKETKGFYPAPLAALEAIKKTFNSSHLESSLKKETQMFCQVAVTPVSKNLIRIFFLTNSIKNQKLSETSQPIHQVGVLGGGTMGGGIAYLCADNNCTVRLKDVQPESVSKSLDLAHKLWSKQCQKKRITPYQWKQRADKFSGCLDYSGFSKMDFVIEAVSEDIHIKKKVIEETAKHLKQSAIMASNTSSLSIKKLSEFYPSPERFVGMHFFNPVYKMPLVEIIKTDRSDPQVISSVFNLAKKLGKIPVIVKDSPGFVVNRMLMPYLTEALWFLSEGCQIEEVDRCYTHHFGLPMGPFRLMDEIGLDICTHVIAIFQQSQIPMETPEFTQNLVPVLGLGKKSGKGFYEYASKTSFPNENLRRFQKDKIKIKPEDLIGRGIYRIINEGHKILQESVVDTENDIDIAMIFGTGFPPFLGGPMQYAKTIGLKKLKQQLHEYQYTLGNRFEPCSSL